MDISIIICSRNRCGKLAAALESFAAMMTPDGIQWEAIVVDNGSTDETAVFCNGWVAKQPERNRYIHEPRKGKSIALNTGIKISRGNVLVFTDDDCLVDQGWIETILHEYTLDPTLAVLGGRVELYNPEDKPLTLVNGKNREIFSSPRSLFPNPPIIGANMAARREVFLKAGGFDVLMGPGTNAIAEDVDFIYRAYRKGFRIVYSPSVLVYHNHGRQTDAEARALEDKYDIGRGAFYCKHTLSGDWQVIRMLLGDLKSTLGWILTLNNVPYRARFLRGLVIGALSRFHLRTPK